VGSREQLKDIVRWFDSFSNNLLFFIARLFL